MPMRWDATNDRNLLLLILQTSNVSVDADAIAENWPTDENPTPRAIKERITKLHSEAASRGIKIARASISMKGSNKASTPRTPRTPAGTRRFTPKTPASKRSKLSTHSSNSGSSEDGNRTIPIREVRSLSAGGVSTHPTSSSNAPAPAPETPTHRIPSRRAASVIRAQSPEVLTKGVKREYVDEDEEAWMNDGFVSPAESDVSAYHEFA